MEARTYDDLIGRTAYDCDGDRIGEIKDIYYDDVSGRPEWVEVKAGVFTGSRLVPIDGATIRDDDDVQLAHDQELVKTAPDFDLGDVEHVDAAWEQQLYTHYGFNYAEATPTGTYGQTYGTSRFDRDYALPPPTTTTESDVVEEVDVATERPTVGTETTTRKARLRKYTVHGTETVEVPVSHEEVRLEVDSEETGRDA